MDIEKKISSRLKDIGEYAFFAVAEAKKKALASGKDVIDLGGGNPDLPPHPKPRTCRKITGTRYTREYLS